MLYPSLCLSTGNVIVARSNSRMTKRDNSCLRYIDKAQTQCWGILEKIFGLNISTLPTYFSTLVPACQLCTDEVTCARLQDHYVACPPPWLAVKLSHTHTYIIGLVKLIQIFCSLHSCSVQQHVVVPCASVLEKCVVMDLKPQLDLLFVSLLPNTEEID